ncbi:MAG: cytochrome c3 family protein [Planctomycetaceae bacterium]|jgi:hypothetical protein|nr:cytochrome c3 family protein [Planctomycetaceae bacterium]
MAKNEFTSIFLPGTPVPEPPDWRPLFSMFFQVIVILAFLIFIGFLFFDTVMDIAGKPIWSGGVEIVRRQTIPPTADEVALQFSLITPLSNSRISSGRVTIICIWQSDPFTLLKYSKNELTPPYEPELFIDGRKVDWDISYGFSWLAQVELKPGLHDVKAGGFTGEFMVDGNSGNDKVNANANVNDNDNYNAEINVGIDSENLLSEAKNKITTSDANKNNWQANQELKIKRALWPVMRSHSFVDDAGKCAMCHEIIENKNEIESKRRKILQPVRNATACISCHDKNKIHIAHGKNLNIWENCSKCHALHGTNNNRKNLLRNNFLPK